MTLKDAELSDTPIFTVPPGARFVDALAKAVLAGRLPDQNGMPPDPLALPDTTILLPTRRAARALQDAFLTLAGPKSAMLLPKMRPVAEGDEDATLIAGLTNLAAFAGDLDLPPAVSELERRLVLMQLVQRWSEIMRTDGNHLNAAAGARTPAQAAQMAAELARLIDTVETENVDLTNLVELVPDEYSAHWQQTLNFLNIIVAWWPEHLKERGKLSPMDRRNRVILAEAERLRLQPPEGPVIVAGVTGSIPATAELMRVVAQLPNGAIVLPGFDRGLDADTRALIVSDHPEHPQSGLIRLLRSLNIDAANVRDLSTDLISEDRACRNLLVSEVMRPSATTDEWHLLPDRFDQELASRALHNISYLPAPNAQDEAEAVALILREAAEHPGRTAALVSPDRLLARRVAVRLESWGIRVDDSAGRPFAKTVPGAFIDLVIDAVAKDFEPKSLMALLKHPLTRLAQPAFDIRRAARSLEIAAFRTPYLGSGLGGVDAALERAKQDVEAQQRRGTVVSRLWQEDWDLARKLVQDLKHAYSPLVELFQSGAAHPLSILAQAHITVAEALSAVPDQTESGEQLWRDEAGAAGAQLFTGLLDQDLPAPELTAQDYPDFYRTLVANEAVRPQIPTHPRIFIWGPFEARLLQPDVVILGSLNDGTWPEAADPGPWLNRPMRRDLGLPSPEEQIGYAAHDFTQLLGAETVYLTRSETVDSNPAVPSRWILRLQTVLAKLGISEVLDPDKPWLSWARARDTVENPRLIKRPEPRPPLELRPRRLSVSAIETWIANPYAIFADRILKLSALPPLGEDPDAGLRGSVVHEALGRFAEAYPSSLPDDPAERLIEISSEIFDELKAHPRIAAFWISRFERFARWFGEHEASLRDNAERTLGEINGAHVLSTPTGPFTLTARADRIDIRPDGLAITDYKTGANLNDLASRAKIGKAPQLLLEALIAREDGFAGVASQPISTLRYISAAGGDPPGAVVTPKFEDIATSIDQVVSDLTALIALYDNEQTAYIPTRRAQFRYDYDDYAHLSRIAEWGGEATDEVA